MAHAHDLADQIKSMTIRVKELETALAEVQSGEELTRCSSAQCEFSPFLLGVIDGLESQSTTDKGHMTESSRAVTAGIDGGDTQYVRDSESEVPILPPRN